VFVLSVGLSVSLLETSVYFYFDRMAETTGMPFGVVGWVGPGKNMYLSGCPNPSMETGNFGGA